MLSICPVCLSIGRIYVICLFIPEVIVEHYSNMHTIHWRWWRWIRKKHKCIILLSAPVTLLLSSDSLQLFFSSSGSLPSRGLDITSYTCACNVSRCDLSSQAVQLPRYYFWVASHLPGAASDYLSVCKGVNLCIGLINCSYSSISFLHF